HRARASAVLLSPVFPTRSHPGAAVLGALRFLLMAQRSPLPVIALGGMTKRRAARKRLGCDRGFRRRGQPYGPNSTVWCHRSVPRFAMCGKSRFVVCAARLVPCTMQRVLGQGEANSRPPAHPSAESRCFEALSRGRSISAQGAVAGTHHLPVGMMSMNTANITPKANTGSRRAANPTRHDRCTSPASSGATRNTAATSANVRGEGVSQTFHMSAGKGTSCQRKANPIARDAEGLDEFSDTGGVLRALPSAR
ncbi:MAG: hypothetical protein RL354_1140, partial [Planctomycetota bacterium]